MSDHTDSRPEQDDLVECDGCGLVRNPVQTVDVFDGTESYCIACAEVPA